jgi:hypothetical protein
MKNSAVMEVTVPVVRLTVEDLSYLRSMEKDGPRCHIKGNRLAKLKLLGLVKVALKPPSDAAVSAYHKDVEKFKRDCDGWLASEKWEDMAHDLNQLVYTKRRLMPSSQDVISEAGRKLLENGKVKVELPHGCADQ